MALGLKNDYSFPKEQRILKTKDYRSSFDLGLKYLSADFVYFARSSKSPRLGVVVSRKVGNAVCRNKVKRLLRESYRNLGEILDFDLVVVARSRSKQLDFAQVNATFLKSLVSIRNLLHGKKRERA